MSTGTNNMEVCVHCEKPTLYSICNNVECDSCDMSVETKLIKQKNELWDKVYPKVDEKMKGKVIITSTPKGQNKFYDEFINSETSRKQKRNLDK